MWNPTRIISFKACPFYNFIIKLMSWFARIIAHHPYAVITAIAVFSCTCIVLPLTVVKLPNFRDPQLGFEARGTEIGQRLTAWANLLDNISPSGPLTVKPALPIKKPKVKSMTFPSFMLMLFFFPLVAFIIFVFMVQNKGKIKENKNETIPLNEFTPRSETQNISFIFEPDIHHSETDSSEDNWISLKEIDTISHHEHEHISSDLYFCNNPNIDYGRVVMSSTDGSDLFQLDSLLVMCLLEAELISYVEYSAICQTISENRCCRLWSLPNYVAMLNNKTSCLNITTEDVENAKQLVMTCQRYFLDLNHIPDYSNRDMPTDCTRNNALYDMINYILEYDYTENSSLPLQNVMAFMPIAKSSAALDYFHSISSSSLELDNVKVSGIDFGLKNTLFDDYLIKDTKFIGFGAIMVLICIWCYTGSFFITTMIVIAIVFSLGISYFVYMLVLEFKFFPFMNLLATVVAVGIGGDASLMVCRLWTHAKESENNIVKLVQKVHGNSVICILVSSMTTALAFYSSFVSNITAICCFSTFAGTAVLANFIIMTVWTPATIVISEKLPSLHILPMNMKTTVDSWSNNLRSILIDAVLKLKYFWIALFTLIALSSFPIIFYYPRLRLPDSPDFQLFSSSHPFEQYEMNYRDRFRFERILKMDTSLNTRMRLPMRFVWGVLPVDNGDYMDPFSRGKLVLDPTFDLAAKDSQTWLYSFCTKLREQPFYHPTSGPLLPNCFIKSFVDWMKRKCVDPVEGLTREPCCESAKFPFERKVFTFCIPQAAMSLYLTPGELSMPGVAGPKFAAKSKSKVPQAPRVKVIVVEYDANYTLSTSFVEMDKFYQEVEGWSRKELSQAPPGMRNGWFVSELSLYDLQKTLAKDTYLAIIISMGSSFVVVVATTLNVLLSILAMTTITFIILVTVAVLILLGWKLNILEAIAVSLAIGLSVDFAMHYIVKYRMAPDTSNRETATVYSMSMMAGPVLMAATTTFAAGAFMIPSSVLAYRQIGIFLVVVMTVSWCYSNLFLPSLLSVVGPVEIITRGRRAGREAHELEALGRARRRAEHSPSAASATTIIHDEDCEISVLKPNPST